MKGYQCVDSKPACCDTSSSHCRSSKDKACCEGGLPSGVSSSRFSQEALEGHKWGFKDSGFVMLPDKTVSFRGNRYDICGKMMPYFIPYVERRLAVTIDVNDINRPAPKGKVQPPLNNPEFLKALSATFPSSQYSQDDELRLIHSHGQATSSEVYRVIYDHLERLADVVFYPECEPDVVKVIALASDHNVCLVPYGGGTSVTGALLIPVEEKRMVVSIDMRRMNRILSIDFENRKAVVEAGITGDQLEKDLNQYGVTSGHEPDSVELSTLGGWISTNASGMKKNRYGNIEEIVESFTLITPTGSEMSFAVAMPRISIGMQPPKLLFGSEGTMGVITKAVLRIHNLPEVKKYESLVFPNFEKGLRFMESLAKHGALPASVRLVDNFQFLFGASLKPKPKNMWESLLAWAQKFLLTHILRFDHNEMVAATLVMEGPKDVVQLQQSVISRLAKAQGGMWGGEANGRRGYMLTFAIAYIRDFLADYYVIGETYETTVPWTNIRSVIEAVSKKADELHKSLKLPGVPFVSARITQLYHTGVCIYFTHGFYMKGIEKPHEVFCVIEESLRKEILRAGGSVSHHHGVGKIRQCFMGQALTPSSITLLRQMKQSYDPKNIFGIRNNVMTKDESEISTTL